RLRGKMACYPNGRASTRVSSNYAHINSVYVAGDELHLIYHNETHKTGRRSRWVTLNRELQVVESREIDGGCAHNITYWRGQATFCDSQGSSLVWGNRRIHLGVFTRGIAATDDVVFVGGS